jgi:hypothetical protein
MPRIDHALADRLRPLLGFPDSAFSAIDPYCGDGRRLALLTAATHARTYGFAQRREDARRARRRLGRALHSPLDEARVSARGASLVVLAPPADAAPLGYVLRRASQWLVPGGVLALAVPGGSVSADAADLARTALRDIALWRELVAGRDLTLLVGRAPRAARERPQPILPRAPAAGRQWAIPPSPPLRTFATVWVDPADVAEALAASPLWPAFWSQGDHRPAFDRRPPLPLHRGHLGLLLAAGELDGLVGQGPDRHLVRGIVRKTQITTAEHDDQRRTTRGRESFVADVKLLFPDGTLRRLSQAAPTPAAAPPEAAGDDGAAANAGDPPAPALAPRARRPEGELSPLTGRLRRRFAV